MLTQEDHNACCSALLTKYEYVRIVPNKTVQHNLALQSSECTKQARDEDPAAKPE